MKRTGRQTILLWIERFAAGVAVVCLGWVSLVTVQARLYDRQQRRVFEQQRTASRTAGDVSRVEGASVSDGDNAVIGLLEIPRLGFSEVLAEGDGDDTLRIAIGHLPDTPLPWQPGNSAFAGHRDGRFRPLEAIRVGDRIRLVTRHGDLDYVLRKTMIVTPEDVWVLNPTTGRTLTLITCFPFVYVGKAPKRFVMKADAVGGS